MSVQKYAKTAHDGSPAFVPTHVQNLNLCHCKNRCPEGRALASSFLAACTEAACTNEIRRAETAENMMALRWHLLEEHSAGCRQCRPSVKQTS